MNLLLKTCVVAVIFLAMNLYVCSEASAAEWRWARPLNEKVGSIFYSSNARFKRSDAYKSRSRSPSRTYPANGRSGSSKPTIFRFF